MLSEADIDRIGEGVVARTLPKAEWTHAAHFAAAVWVLTGRQYDAARDMPGLIRAYNEATGVANTDTDGYHETITQASLRAASAWLDAHAGQSRAEALASLLASPYGRSDWLLIHWSREALFSAEARRGWLEPDLKPLPF
jgi:hypothetical protein